MIKQLLELSLSQAVQAQIKAGVPAVPKDHADEILTQVAQLDASKLRGLIVIAATDLEDPVHGNGVGVNTFVVGTPATLEPLLDLGNYQVAEKLENPTQLAEDELCPGCGEKHGGQRDVEDFIDQLTRRGPSLSDAIPVGSAMHELLAAVLLGPMHRRR